VIAKWLPREQAAVENEITAEIEELWQTRPTRGLAGNRADEVDSVWTSYIVHHGYEWYGWTKI